MDDLEKALEQIVRAFLLNETIPLSSKDNESTKQNVEEQEEINKNNSASAPAPGPSIVVPQLPDDEFISNLYQCLAERGIIREIHAFLRQRLVEILKGSFPHVVVSGCDGNFNPTVMKLLDDFLCCHKLLFTYSVLVTELDNKLEMKQDFGKIYSRDAEALLGEMGIHKGTELSRKILRQYSEKEHASLLECVIGVASWGNGNETSSWWDSFGADLKQGNAQLYSSYIDASLKTKRTDNERAEKLVPSENLPQLESVDDRLFLMLQDMERDKESEIRIAMAKFREEETGRIRDEIIDRMKFEFLSKEKELLRNYDDRVKHMKHLLDREKEIWSLKKAKIEKELFDQRQDLIKLTEHVQHKRVKLQEALAHTRNRKLNSASNSQSSECSGADVQKSRCAEKKTKKDEDNSFCEFVNVNQNPAPALMKSIKLESTINRLKEENERLKRKLYSYIHSQGQGQVSHSHKHSRSRNCSNHNSSTDNDTSQSVEAVVEGRHSHSRKQKEINNDKLALLQYTVEQQTAEVEKLKRHLQQDHSTSSDKFASQPTEFQSQAQPINEIEPNALKSSTTQDNADLETFLAESKLRFAAIEKKAELVGSSLREVFKRKNGSTYSGIGDSSSSCIRMAGFADGDAPPLVPKLPSNLKQSAHNSHTGQVVTQSLLAPRFMSTATSSIDQALKSFLMNQTEDIYTGSTLAEIKIPESPHVSRLKIANALQTIQSIEHIRASNKRKVQNQKTQMRKHSIPTPASEFDDPVSIPIEIPISRQSQAGETDEHSKPESVRLFNDSTSNLDFPISLKPQATTVSNSRQVVPENPENESNVLAMDKETVKIKSDGVVQNQTHLEKPSPASSTDIPENNPQELPTVLLPPSTSKVPELPSLSPSLLKKLELQRSTASAMINATMAQSLSSLPFLNQSDDDSAEKGMTKAVGLVHTESHVPSLKTDSQKKTKELYDTSSEESEPESHDDNSNTTTIESPGVALSGGGSKSEPAIETALKQTRVQIPIKSDFNVNVKPTLDTAASSGALIQYKVPSPFSEDTSEGRDLGVDQPLKSSKVAHRDLELGTLGGVPSPSSKPQSEGVKKKSHSSENSLSFSDISHADVHGDGDAFEMMTEEDFWAL